MSTKGDRRRVLLVTFGCRAAQADETALAGELAAAGFEPVPGARSPDPAATVVSGCVVTARAERDARKAVRRIRREHPGTFLVAAGCTARAGFPDRLRDCGVDLFYAGGDPGELARILSERLDGGGMAPIGAGAAASPAQAARPVRARAALRIQDGCDEPCAFCVVPLVRGPARSVPAEVVMDRFNRLADQGAGEIVLTGTQTGAWGIDLDPPSALPDLLELLLSRTSRPRIRISSVEPQHLSGRLVDLLTTNGRVCPHLHVPIQSASRRLMAAMGRPDGNRAASRIERSLRRFPTLAVGFDVMAGLPTESDDDFAQTTEMLERLPLAYLHVFTYSPRTGTRAPSLAPRVPERVAVLRTRELLRIDERLRRAYRRSLVGRAAEVVVESIGADRSIRGTTERFVPAVVVGAVAAPGAIVHGTIESVSAEGVARVVACDASTPCMPM